MRVFVGLGEGIGNVVMGLPLIDGLHAEGHTVTLHTRLTPESIRDDVENLVASGRSWLGIAHDLNGDYEAACLTHWWLSRGGKLPKSAETFVGLPPSDEPEIDANLAAAPFLATPSRRAVLHFARAPKGNPPLVAIHPGCKDDPEWKRRKVYPRWAEVTHRLKDRSARVVILGMASDDAYCGEPHEDLRGRTTSLSDVARALAGLDCLVSGDSGLHHMAVALGVPTVAVFGESSIGKARHPEACEPPRIVRFEDGPTHVAELVVAAMRDAGSSGRDTGFDPDPVT